MTTVEFTPEALVAINQMRFKVNEISANFGEGSPQHVKAADSLARSLVAMIELGGQISRDGDLSLYGVNEYGLHYGVVFHSKDATDGFTHSDGEVPAGSFEKGEYIYGEWSVHS